MKVQHKCGWQHHACSPQQGVLQQVAAESAKPRAIKPSKVCSISRDSLWMHPCTHTLWALMASHLLTHAQISTMVGGHWLVDQSLHPLCLHIVMCIPCGTLSTTHTGCVTVAAQLSSTAAQNAHTHTHWQPMCPALGCAANTPQGMASHSSPDSPVK